MSRREGYIIDVPYPLYFYKEMQPCWLAYVATSVACRAPDIRVPYRYCELGCGAGINLLVAAAGNPLGEFVGVDFNAGHIALARQAADKIGLDNVQFVEASFAEFAQEQTAPFDFIACHGTWSWLSPQAQRGILQIIQEQLQPGGLLYLHYMCYPGSARLSIIQKLLHEASLGAPGNSAEAAKHGLQLLRRLADSGAGVFADDPGLEPELVALEKEHLSYLAHDFLTDHWRPQHSADLHRILAQTGLTYIGSANCFENMDRLSIPGNVQPILAGLTKGGLRETVKDMARNQHQRMDLLQRQPRVMTADQHLAEMDRIRWRALPSMPVSGAISFATPIGCVPGPQEIFQPLLRALHEGATSFAQLRDLTSFAKEPGLLLQALQMLMWGNYIHPLRPDKAPVKATQAFDAWMLNNKIGLSLQPDCGTAFLTR
jgi:hypothetical protein